MPLEHVHEQVRLHNPKRSFVQYRVDKPGCIIPVGHRLSAATHHPCVIRSLSSAGAVITISGAIRLPENFYLEVDGIRDDIPCTEFKRSGDELVVRFNMFLDPDFLDLVLGRKGKKAE